MGNYKSGHIYERWPLVRSKLNALLLSIFFFIVAA